MAGKPATRHRSDDVERPDFEFCVAGRPVSAQAENRLLLQQWKAEVTSAAQAVWGAARPPLREDVALRVTHYSARRVADRDNLMKPIQDALETVVYGNDRQVKDATSNWRNINGRFTIRYLARPLAIAFSDGTEFLHIRIWISSETEDLG